jgi:hypothetical protein
MTTSSRDPFDVESLRINLTDPAYVPKGSAGKSPKKNTTKWQRKFVLLPWTWIGRLKTAKYVATYKLAILLAYEHWRRGGGGRIKLTNSAAAEMGVSRRTKWPALNELEQAGLIKVERRGRKSPAITILIDPISG